jgi:hypothetical protein
MDKTLEDEVRALIFELAPVPLHMHPLMRRAAEIAIRRAHQAAEKVAIENEEGGWPDMAAGGFEAAAAILKLLD